MRCFLNHIDTYCTYIHTYIHTYIRTHIHTYTHSYVHTFIRTYVHTYIHTYIHTYTQYILYIETGETLYIFQHEIVQYHNELFWFWIHDSRFSVQVPYSTQLKHTHTHTHTHTLIIYMIKDTKLKWTRFTCSYNIIVPR